MFSFTSSGDMQNVLETLLESAKGQIRDSENLSNGQLEAELSLQMIRLAENTRTHLRLAQGIVVARVSREKLYEAHRKQYPNVREFLRAAGLGESTVSDLVALGDILIPFCDEHRIKIDKMLCSKQWPKFREAIPALRRAVKARSIKGVKAILKDIKQMPTRDLVRQKYRRQRSMLGYGTTIRCSDGRLVLVAVINGGSADEVAGKMACILDLNSHRPRNELLDILTAALQAVVDGQTDAD